MESSVSVALSYSASLSESVDRGEVCPRTGELASSPRLLPAEAKLLSAEEKPVWAEMLCVGSDVSRPLLPPSL